MFNPILGGPSESKVYEFFPFFVVLILISIPMMIHFESIHEVVPAVRPCAPSSDRPYSAHGGSLCKLKPAPTGMGFYTESRRSAIHYSYFQISGAFWCQSVSQQLTV